MKYLTVVFGVLFGLWLSTRIVAGIVFDRNCSGYLERAAKANTVEYAQQNLKVALNYLQASGKTSGYTSVIYTTPDEDVSYFYNNIQHAEAQLESVTSTTSELEKSNLLLKLHETLMTHDGDGESAIVPDGISVYPYNVLFFVWGWGSFVIASALVVGLIIS
jgi:hypothetical protein